MTSPSSSLPEKSGTDLDPPAQPNRNFIPDSRRYPSDQPDAPADRNKTQRAKSAPWFTPLLRRLHFYAGIFVGPFILVAAISGGLYALSPQVEKIIYADQLNSSSRGVALPLADQIDAANAFIGEGQRISAVRPAPEPGMTTRVMYADENLGDSESRAIFVDPATAEVKGDLTVYGTSGALPLRTWIDQFHRSLQLGDFGRYYSELAASWLGIIAVAGLCLWIVRARKSKKAAAAMLKPSNKHKGLRRTFSWHASVGVWIAIGMLFLSATGITWSQLGGDNVSKLREALNWTTPSVSTALGDNAEEAPSGEHAGHDMSGMTGAGDPSGNPDSAAFDMFLSMAQNVNVNTGLVEIKPPADENSAWVVQEIQRSFPTEVDSVAFDPTTMAITDRADFADFPIAAKLSRWGIDLHMGSMFGLPNQIALVVLAAGIAAMVVWGYVMWWQRRPKHDTTKRFGIAPARGALAQAPWWGVALVALVAIGVGLFLPLVGISLVGFVLVDVIVGFVARRRSRTT